MRILLADAHLEVRTALRLVLERQAGHQVAGESRDVINMMAQVTRHCPQAVLLDLDLPGLQPARRAGRSSLGELVEMLHHHCPTLRIIVLSSRPDAEKECRLAKVDAFFCKIDPPDALLALLENY